MDSVSNSLQLNLSLLNRMIASIPEAKITEQTGATPNHPAWTIGHLAHSFEAIGGEIGLPSFLPTEWSTRFGTGSSPTPSTSDYPSKEELVATLQLTAERLLERIRKLSAEDLQADLPDVRYRQTFPTVEHALVHIISGHLSLHIGQLSCWMRAFGLAPASEMDGR